MTPESRDGWNSLRDAVARAIAANRALAEDTAAELSALAERLHPTTPPRPLAGADALADSPAELVLDAERALIGELADELKDLAHRQLDGLDTFNIVLFGRTGVGKSSLLEALSHGGGGSISPSDSDWTTTVNPVDWAHCRVVDTPGIEGWGRTVSREELEQKAREELVTADVVLLCFDSQNQKAGEFRKVAEWIAEFNKPVVAVLNVRLPHWRFPTRVPRRAQRLRNSQTVADHAAHIHEVLTTIGLADAPIIATHTQRAVFARACEPFELPDDQLTTMRSQRAEVGAEQLLAWSNLPALEGLLATAVEGGAGALRRGALLNQTVETLHRMSGVRLPEFGAQVVADAEQTEAGIGRMLDVLGAPEVYLDNLAEDDPEHDRVAAFIKRLGELETARGGRFAAPASGSARRYGRNVVDDLLTPLRTAARERAEALIDRAMAERKTVSREDFLAAVFDTDEIERVTRTAAEQLTAFLRRRVGVAAEDVVADLAAVNPQSAKIKGKAGRGHRWAAGAVLAAPLASTGMLAFAVANSWNPAGWMVAAAAAVGLAAKPISGLLRRLGVKKHEKELSRARGEARRSVTETFDEVRDGITDRYMTAARAALLSLLGAAVDQAYVLRKVAETAQGNKAEVATTTAPINGRRSREDDPAAVFLDATQSYEAEVGVAGRALWLGESWCDDPTGLRDDRGPVETVHRGESVMGRLVRDRLGTVLAQAALVPSPGSGRYWLAQVGDLLEGDEVAAPMLAHLAELLADPRPRVLVYGDYNVGKSSLIRRLLVDEGEPVPPTLTVRGRPETKDVAEYRWGRYVMIDTPGLQSGVADHDDAAHRTLPDAAFVLYVLGANAVTSDRAGLDLVLRGDPDRGVLPKLDRTVFVVNRADELSPDPLGDQKAFARSLARREREVRAALVGPAELRLAGVAVPPERILFVASDPFGRVGEETQVTPAAFDEYRDWDGMDALGAAFDEVGPGLAANGVDVSTLHAGIGALGALTTAAEADVAREDAAITQLDRLTEDVRAVTREGLLIAHTQPLALTRLVLDFVDAVIGEALAIADDDTRDERLEKAVQFWEDPDLRQQLDEWAAETEHRVGEWVRESSILLQRRVESQAFQRALTPERHGKHGRVQFPGRSSSRPGVKDVGSALGTAIDVVGHLRAIRVVRIGGDQASRVLLSGLLQSRVLPPANQTVYRLMTVAKSGLIRRRAAAQSTNILRTAGRAAALVQVGMTLVDFGLLARDFRADDRRQAEFAAARTALLRQAVEWADRHQKDDPSLAVLDKELAALERLATKTAAERSARQETVDAAADRCARYEHAIHLGRQALGDPDDEARIGGHRR